MYAFLMADFLAVTQVLVYVGGILVLIVFGVMLTNRQVSVDIKTSSVQTVPAIAVVGALAGTLSGIIWSAQWPVLPELQDATATAPVIGEMFLSSYLLPFEIASVILLVALVGAAMIARREKQA
jgi:NADH-quinone oxidoreductase subunit J